MRLWSRYVRLVFSESFQGVGAVSLIMTKHLLWRMSCICCTLSWGT